MTLQEFTLTMLQTLPPYEEHILRSRFGFSGCMASTVSVPGHDQSMAGGCSVNLTEYPRINKMGLDRGLLWLCGP
jgi:hypothetical protein